MVIIIREDELTEDLDKFFIKISKEGNPTRDIEKVLERYGIDFDLISEKINKNRDYKIPYVTEDILEIMVKTYPNDPFFSRKFKNNVTLEDLIRHNEILFKEIDKLPDYLRYKISNTDGYKFNKKLNESLSKLLDRLNLLFDISLSETTLSEGNQIDYLIEVIDQLLFAYAQREYEKNNGKGKFYIDSKDIKSFEKRDLESAGHLLDKEIKQAFIDQIKLNSEIDEYLCSKEPNIHKLMYHTDKTKYEIDQIEEQYKNFIEEFKSVNKNGEDIYKWYLKKRYNEDYSFKNIEENYKKEESYKNEYLSYSYDIKKILYEYFNNKLIFIVIEASYMFLNAYIGVMEQHENLNNFEEELNFLYGEHFKIIRNNRFQDYYYDLNKFGFITLSPNSIVRIKFDEIISKFLLEKTYNLFKEIYLKDKLKLNEFVDTEIRCKPYELYLDFIFDNENDYYVQKLLKYVYPNIMKELKSFIENDKEIEKENKKFQLYYETLVSMYSKMNQENAELYSLREKCINIDKENGLLTEKRKKEKDQLKKKELDDKIISNNKEKKALKKKIDNYRDIRTYISKAMGQSLVNSLFKDKEDLQNTIVSKKNINSFKK